VLELGKQPGDVYWVAGEPWRRVRGSGQIIGMKWNSVLASFVSFEGTPPLGGAWLLSEVVASTPRQSSNTALHRLQLAIGDSVPAAQSQIDAMEQVLPMASTHTGQESSLYWSQYLMQARFAVERALWVDGRRLVAGLTHTGASTIDMYVGLTMEELERVREVSPAGQAAGGVMGELRIAAKGSLEPE